MKHTPGPWTAFHYGIRDVGGYICELRWPTRYDGQEARYLQELAEREGDARLIAAAPEMLAALERTLDWLASYPGEGTMGIGGPYEQVRAAIAIAKATVS